MTAGTVQHRILKILVLVLVSHHVYSQEKLDSLENLFGVWYDSVVGLETNDLLYNSVYLTALRGTTTHQYFDQRVWQEGSLTMDGERYGHVSMLFDIDREQLVVRHPDAYRFDGIAVNMETLSSFTLADHHFRKFSLVNGISFFDVLFEGPNILLLAKRSKKSSPQKAGIEFTATTNYFIVDEDRLVPMMGIKTLKKLYPNSTVTIQNIRKKEKIRIKKRKESTIVRFIESLDKKMETNQ